MKLSRIFTALMAAVGTQLPSCEYGAEYAVFKNYGVVCDENGKGIRDARVDIDEVDYEPVDSVRYERIREHYATEYTDRYGEFESEKEIYGAKSMTCRIITTKQGYEPDTNYFRVSASEFIGGNGDRDEGTATKKHIIILKKEIDKDE